MRKLFLLLSLLSLAGSLLAIKTSKSIFYSDSYMLRARGVEAAYWNPANISSGKYIDWWLPLANTGVQVTNNAFDLDTYNDFVSDDYLDAAEKATLLGKIDGNLRADISGNHSIIGFTLDNMSFSSSLSYMGKSGVSKRYLEMALLGNSDTLYVFDKKDNYASGISYLDFSFGLGNLQLPLGEKIPPIRAGVSGSVLVGVASGYTERFDGYLKSTLDGISAHQDLTLRSAIGGLGFKTMLGLASTVSPGLEVGLTLDNLMGNLKWLGNTEDRCYSVLVDSLYVSDLSEDFYTQNDTILTVGSFSTELPPELRLAAMYSHPRFNISADYVQGFKSSAATDNTGRIALGAELKLLPFLHLQSGLGFGNSSYPWRISYGFSINSSTFEAGLSVQSFRTLIPNPKTKGIAVGTFLRLWI